MIITVASFKGGVGKTTTALHLAAFFAERDKTILVDSDLNRSASRWGERGAAPFEIYDEKSIGEAGEFTHMIIDTAARPADKDLIRLTETSDLLVIPSATSAFAVEAVVQTIGILSELPQDSYKILLTIVPPPPSKEGEKVQKALKKAGLSVFKHRIRRYSVYGKAEAEGCIVKEVKSDRYAGIAWGDYVEIGKEILA